MAQQSRKQFHYLVIVLLGVGGGVAGRGRGKGAKNVELNFLFSLSHILNWKESWEFLGQWSLTGGLWAESCPQRCISY